MDVLMFTSDVNALRPGSATEKRLLEYATAGAHFLVVVLNTRRDRYAPRRASKNLWIAPVNAPLSILAPFLAVAIAKRQLFFQGTLQTDVVDGRDAELAGLAAWLVARRYHKPLHFSLTNNALSSAYASESLRHWFGMLLARFLAPAADAVSTNSESSRAALAALSVSLGDRTLILPRYVDVEAVQKSEVRSALTATYPQFKFILLCVAPLSPEYNVQLAITTLAGVLRVYPYAGLVIVGSGKEKRRLAAYAARIKVASQVVFEGPHEDMHSYYKTAHVLLMTAPSQENDDVVAQAAAAGCVVISTKVGLAPLIIESGVSGFLCDPGDPACFVAGVTSMLKDPTVRERVKTNLMLATEKYMGRAEVTGRVEAMRQAWQMAVKNFRALNAAE